ncbi:MAG: hypothetical protein ACE5KT_10780 [Methanosarcinales archaeon]
MYPKYGTSDIPKMASTLKNALYPKYGTSDTPKNASSSEKCLVSKVWKFRKIYIARKH